MDTYIIVLPAELVLRISAASQADALAVAARIRDGHQEAEGPALDGYVFDLDDPEDENGVSYECQAYPTEAGQPVVMATEYYCRGCGREESVCSADPCADVIADRNS